MSTVNLNTNPYYDDYDSTKEYTKILAIPGRVAQAREITQLQTMLLDQIGKIGKASLPNGAIVSGCNINIVGGTSVEISAGEAFINGLVRKVPGATLAIRGSGTEYIGAVVNESIVTEDNDASLKDIVVGNDNYGKPGAHRLKETVSLYALDDFSLNNYNNVAILFTIIDGALRKSTDTNDSTNTSVTTTSNSSTISSTDLTPTLARRSFDENGSYTVRGLQLTSDVQYLDIGIEIPISEGKAYIEGYEITKPNNSYVYLDYCNETYTIYNEGKSVATGGQLTFTTVRSPIKSVESLRMVRRCTFTMYAGSVAGGQDELPASLGSVNKIISITGEGGRLYAASNYTTDGAVIDWSNGYNTGNTSNYPSSGSMYTVTLDYNEVINDSSRFNIVNSIDSETGKFKTTITVNPRESNDPSLADEAIQQILELEQVDSVTNNGNNPVEITYSYYISRTDLITLDKKGFFKVVKGVPRPYGSTKVPSNTDKSAIEIGFVTLCPGLYGSECLDIHKIVDETNLDSTRLSQLELRNLKNRLDNLEYDMAMEDLDKEAADNEQASLLKGILTDGFFGLTKCDLGSSDFNCRIYTDENYVSLPVNCVSDNQVATINTSSSTYKAIGNAYVAPYNETVAIQQPYATTSFLVNPYKAYDNMCLIKISPTTDNWYEDKTAIIENTTTRTWYIASRTAANVAAYKAITGKSSIATHSGAYKLDGKYVESSSLSSSVTYTAIYYMRQIRITVNGSNFPVTIDNLKCYFNNKLVSLTPTTNTYKGTQSGTVKTDSSGKFSAYFTIPANSPCGTADIVVTSDLTNTATAYTASAKFSAQGKIRTTTVYKTTQYVDIYTYDPVAQSFQFSQDTIITRLGLFFKTKDESKSIVVQIRNMVNGYPGTEVLAQAILEPSQISVSGSPSNDSTAMTETRITFDEAVFCEADTQYCFAVKSDSNNYSLWGASLGEKRIGTNTVVSAQPYIAGIMFDSSNSQSWTAQQASDLKFKIYKAEFTGNGEIVYNVPNVGSFNKFQIAAETYDHKNSGLEWHYKVPNGTWERFYLDEEVDLGSAVSSMSLKAVLKKQDNVSPMIYNNIVDFIPIKVENSGAYVSRRQLFEQTFNTVSISYEAIIPEGTKVNTYIKTANAWVKVDMVKSTQLTVDKWRYTCTKTITASDKYAIKLEFTTNNIARRPEVYRLISTLKNTSND